MAPEQWVVLLLLDFLTSLFYLRDVIAIFDSLLCWFAGVALVSTKMLNRVWALDDDLIEHKFKLAHIVPVCSCYDYRQRDATLVHQDMAFASVFFPGQSG